MLVSSVNWPGNRLNIPPPTMSVMGTKEPRGMNSTVVPTASPHAKPSKAPRARLIRSNRKEVPLPLSDLTLVGISYRLFVKWNEYLEISIMLFHNFLDDFGEVTRHPNKRLSQKTNSKIENMLNHELVT